MNRIPAFIALSFALAAAPCVAQDEPPAADTNREDVLPAVETTPAAEPAPSAESASPPAARSERFKTMDRLELDSSAITGNRELPKVLYIVPWKKADMGDLIGRPANSLLDEVLAPVDREVFRRQTDYFAELNAEGLQPPASGQAQPAAAPSTEPAR
jgi:hypothetical protein